MRTLKLLVMCLLALTASQAARAGMARTINGASRMASTRLRKFPF